VALPKPIEAFEVIEIATGKVVHVVELHGKSPSQIAKVEMGLMRNMDLERFSVRDRKAPRAKPARKGGSR
jgi:hypothetical protein